MASFAPALAYPLRRVERRTQEIGDWWIDTPTFRFTPRSPGTLAFEPPAGDAPGRLVERLPNGKVFEIGPVRDWRPGERLVVSWRQATFGPDHATEVEVRFERVGGETRVTVEHRGWDSVPQEHVARHGFPLIRTNQLQGDQWRAGLDRIRIRVSTFATTNPD